MVAMVTYVSLDKLNTFRYQQYIKEHLTGTLHLINQGVGKKKPEVKKQWLDLVKKLLDSDITLETLAQGHSSTDAQISYDKKTKNYTISQVLSAYPTQQVTLRTSALTEKLVSGTAFLLLNELGSHKASERQFIFEQFQALMPYPVYRTDRKDVNLDEKQLNRINRGEVVIKWRKQFGKDIWIKVLAPWGNSSDLLVMGEMNFFNPYPKALIISAISGSLILISLIILLIVRQLRKKIVQVQNTVDSVVKDYLPDEGFHANGDAFDAMLFKINRMKSRIASLLDEQAYMIKAVSHDLRTPLAKFQFRLENIADIIGYDNNNITACKRDIERLNKLIDELLTYEKLATETPVKFNKINLEEVLETLKQDCYLFNENIKIEIENINNSPIFLQANKGLLIRLFENILINALKFAQSKITICIWAESNNVHCSIKDDGPGIAEDIMNHIFTPFYSSNKGRDYKLSSFGFGLAISKRITEKHKGRINAYNFKNSGAGFEVVLPKKQLDSYLDKNKLDNN